MSDQPDSIDLIISRTLSVLIQQNDLTPEEVAQLRLSHLHLAGKNPSISFTPEGHQEPKVVTLDMETHRALVGWLVNRPDSTADFLFLGSGGEPISPEEIHRMVEQAANLSPAPEPVPKPPIPSTPPESDIPEPAEPQVASGSRPVRPLSRPEIGAPPPGVNPTMASFIPPPTAPEEDETIKMSRPTAAPAPSPRASVSPPPSRPMGASRPPSGPIGRSKPKSPASAAQSATTPPAKTGASEATPDSEATLAGAKKPEKATKEEEVKAGTSPEKPQEKTMVAPAKKETKIEPALEAKKMDRPTAQEMNEQRPGMSRALVPSIIGIVVVCAVCLVGVWLIGQTEPGGQFLASLGLSGGLSQESVLTEPTEEASDAVVFESDLPTPTLPPTATSTSLPPTNTPPPTDTAMPADTPTPRLTNTPTPTETPEPTDTPEIEESPPTTPAAPTPGFKYSAPEIIEPKDGFAFIRGNTILLRWNPVDLAPDEQYAVRLVYTYQGQVTYQGANIKEPEWIMPLSLFGLVDGPDNRYEWYVVVERLNEDGSGTAISPESEHRTFTWK
jgi:hypothetical protein